MISACKGGSANKITGQAWRSDEVQGLMTLSGHAVLPLFSTIQAEVSTWGHHRTDDCQSTVNSRRASHHHRRSARTSTPFPAVSTSLETILPVHLD